MFYAEKIEGNKIAERGVFLSIDEFAPYRIAGWSGTKETNKLADAQLMAQGDRADTWWITECVALTSNGGMSSRATRMALAFHCCD
jgi:hypothetical protein